MRTNPFYDTWLTLIGQTSEQANLGAWKWFFVVLFAVLVASSIWIAVTAWRSDPEQRTFTHSATWLMRSLVGAMWFQNLLWKLPLGPGNGLYFWTEQMAGRAAFQVQRDAVTSILIPNFSLINPVIFLVELAFALSLMLGFGVRWIALLAVPFVLNLWIGLYVERPGDIAEWPWNYLFLAFLMGMFGLYNAGRSLGLDALLQDPYRPGARYGLR
jgi:hypothetical protein